MIDRGAVGYDAELLHAVRREVAFHQFIVEHDYDTGVSMMLKHGVDVLEVLCLFDDHLPEAMRQLLPHSEVPFLDHLRWSDD